MHMTLKTQLYQLANNCKGILSQLKSLTRFWKICAKMYSLL